MAKGSCACGDFTYEVAENPSMMVVCHCVPCRKFAGSNGSTNCIAPVDQYKRLSGNVRNWTRKGDSGKDVTYSSCEKCGTAMTVDAEVMPGVLIYKAGTLDDKSALDNAKPVSEIYTKDRPNCIEAIQGCEQKEAA